MSGTGRRFEEVWLAAEQAVEGWEQMTSIEKLDAAIEFAESMESA